MPRGRPGTRSPNPHGAELFPYIAPRGILRAFTYRRKSKEGKEDDVSLDEQDIACQKLIEGKAWVHVGDAWDRGAEGVDPDRPGYKQMLQWGRDDKFDVLVVWRSDRPFRGVAAAGPLAALLQDTDYRIQLASATDHFDPQYLGINAFTGDIERQGIRRRTMDTRLNRARRGELMHGTLPYWLERDERNHAQLNPERAAIIIELARRYVAGTSSTRELARWMREAAPVTLGSQSWAQWSVERVNKNLKMRALIGQHPYSAARYTRSQHPETGNRMRHRQWKDDESVVYVPVPPLFHDRLADRAACTGCELDDRPTFEEIEQARTRRHTGGGIGAGRPANQGHPLRTLVWCSVCGMRMTLHAHSGYKSRAGRRVAYAEPHLYLRCPRSQGNGLEAELLLEQGKHRCRTPALLRAVDVYAAVCDNLQSGDLPDRIVQAAEEYARSHAARKPHTLADDLRSARRHATALEAQEVQLYKDRGLLSAGAWQKIQTNLVGEQQITQARIAQLEREITQAEAEAELYDVEGARELATSLRAVEWLDLTDDDWGELIRGVVRRVVIDADNRISVELRFRSRAKLHMSVSKQYGIAICNCVA